MFGFQMVLTCLVEELNTKQLCCVLRLFLQTPRHQMIWIPNIKFRFWMFLPLEYYIQWGIWNLTIWNSDFFKVGFQMVRLSNGLVLAIAIVPTIRKPDHSKSGCFCPDFKWFLTKWRPFVRISNGWASGFQMPFKIRTICNLTSFWPFKIRISDPHCNC